MIKKYLQFIKENKDNDNNIRIQDVYENREHINHSELKKYLEDFEDSGYKFLFEDGICDLESKTISTYREDLPIPVGGVPIIPNVAYHYQTSFTISLREPTEYHLGKEEMEYILKLIHRVFKSKTGFEPFYEISIHTFDVEYKTLDKIKISDNGNYFLNSRGKNSTDSLSVCIPTKKIGLVDTDSLINLYDWKEVKKDNNNRSYIQKTYEQAMRYVEVVGMIDDLLEKEKTYFEDGQLLYDYEPDVDMIFQDYLNEENKRLLIDYIINNVDKENVETEIDSDINDGEDLYSKFSDNDIINLLKETDLLQDIKSMYVDMDNISHGSKNYDELHNKFIEVIEDEADGVFLEKENGDKFFNFYLKQDWFENWEGDMDDFEGYAIVEFLDDYMNNMSLKVDPRLSESGDVDEETFNSEVLKIINIANQ